MGILRMECRRAFLGRGMAVCLLLGVLLAVCQCACFYRLNSIEENWVKETEKETGENWGSFVAVSYESHIGEETRTFFNALYFSLFPIFAVLPFAAGFYRDIREGYIKNICSRVPKMKYLAAKYASVFLSGAVGASIPYLVSFLLAACFHPSDYPNRLAHHSSIYDVSVFAGYYFMHPFLYYLCYLAVILAFGGAIAAISLVVTFYSRNMLFVLFVPYLLYTAQDLIFCQIGLEGFSLNMQINPKLFSIYPSPVTGRGMIISLGIILFIPFISYMLVGWKRDCVEWESTGGR